MKNTSLTVQNPLTVSQVRALISHGGDGPITNFVLISRAAKWATCVGCVDSEVVANALFEELEERGMLSDGEVYTPGT